jgi:hypothetical protein
VLDIVKHLFIFNLLVDVGVIVAGGYLGKLWADVLRRSGLARRPKAGAPKDPGPGAPTPGGLIDRE